MRRLTGFEELGITRPGGRGPMRALEPGVRKPLNSLGLQRTVCRRKQFPANDTVSRVLAYREDLPRLAE